MRWLLVALALLLPGVAAAQGIATLVADRITVADGRLVADGNVEAFYDGTRLSAARITYDQASDRLIIDGPIFIDDGGGTLITADQASLDPRLENGMLRGARLVLEQQLQLAAGQMNRVDGRLTQLHGVAATSCRVCSGRAPLWEIRARRVIHDEEARQIYFENAQFRLGGVPILWIPRMRLPDPTLDRATGLLIPSVRSTDQLGVGIKLPYFIKIGDHRDLTLTPYLSASTRTLEARYRQAYLRGEIEVAAALTRDDILPDDTRGYLFADGRFDLGQGYRLAFDIETVTDRAYLLDYGYSDKDRLDSELGVSRYRADQSLRAALTHYNSLREDEQNSTQPTILAELRYDRRLRPAAGGLLELSALAEGHYRYSDTDVDGRDIAHLGLAAEWSRTWITAQGLVAEGTARLAVDHYGVAQDSGYSGDLTRVVPAAAITLRYPLERSTPGGARHLIEPALQIAWSDVHGGTPPNEDSTRIELDEGNLIALSRFPGEDAVETGLRANLGVSWTRTGPGGWHSTLTAGRVIHAEAQEGVTDTSGLSTTVSDWLLSGQLTMPGGFALTGRTLLDDGLDVAKAEARLDWRGGPLDLGATYIWLQSDPDEDRPTAVSEWTLDAAYRIDRAWTLSADARYDVVEDRPVQAGLGVGWENECVTVDVSVSRRFTSSTSLEPTTDFGLAVGIKGFSTGRSGQGPARACTN